MRVSLQLSLKRDSKAIGYMHLNTSSVVMEFSSVRYIYDLPGF